VSRWAAKRPSDICGEAENLGGLRTPFATQGRSYRDCVLREDQRLAAIAVTSTRMPSNASEATPTAARTGHGLLKKRW